MLFRSPQLAKFSQLFKAGGMTSSNALKQSSRSMRLLQDVSVATGKSIDEVTESFNGFLKGNYENGDNILVNTNLGKIQKQLARDLGKSDKEGRKLWGNLGDTGQYEYLITYIGNQYKANGVMGMVEAHAQTLPVEYDKLKNTIKNLTAAIGSPYLQNMAKLLSSVSDNIKAIHTFSHLL